MYRLTRKARNRAALEDLAEVQASRRPTEEGEYVLQNPNFTCVCDPTSPNLTGEPSVAATAVRRKLSATRQTKSE